MEFEEYRIMYEAEDTHWWYRGLRGVMFSMLHLNKPQSRSLKILDAGCGTGGNLAALREAGFKDVEGFDFSESALHFCKERGLDNILLGSIADIPFPDSCFDVVVSCDVLNVAGTINESDALAELYRVLKPGGRLYLNLSAYNWLRSEHDRATDIVRRYTRGETITKLKKTGFTVRRATYWNTLLFPVVVLVRLVRRESTSDLKNPARSDIVLPPRPLNSALTGIVNVERLLLQRVNLPFGSSIAVVAQKPR